VADVDISAARVVAWMWHSMSYKRNAVHVRGNGDLMKLNVDVPNTHSAFQIMETSIPAASNRAWACLWTWRRRSNDDFELALTTIQDLEADNREAKEAMAAIVSGRSSANVVLGELRSSYRVQVLSDNVCRVTLVGQSVPKGWVPKLAIEYATKYLVGFIKHQLQDEYERSGKVVDAELRDVFPPPPLLQHLDDEQSRIAQSCLTLESGSATVEWTPLKSSSPFVSLSMKYTKPVGSEPR
jgi:hypothetical protein